MRQRVVLLQPADAADGQGRPLAATTFATVWASVEPTSGLALKIAQEITSETTYTVVLRYLPGVAAKMSVQFQGRALEILTAMDAQSRHVKWTLICKDYE